MPPGHGLPNVMVVVFDTARADAFDSKGGATPAFADLASRGLAHPRAYATSSWTVPSHLSLFSGRLPRAAGLHHGVQNRAFFREVIRRQGDSWLPKALAAAGYRTFAVSANGWIDPSSGFDQGFDQFRQVVGRRHLRLGSTRPVDRARWVLDAVRANLDDGAEQIADLLRTELAGGRPFFCFVNLVECHSPYLPPRPWNSLPWRERIRAANDANRHCTFEAFWEQAFGERTVPADSQERMKRQYADSIHQLDAWLARLLDLLQQRSLLDDTQVLVTSDHGENLGEAGRTGHSFSLDDRLLRIPFATAGPLDLNTGPVVTLDRLPGVILRALGLSGHPWVEVDDRPVAVAEFVAPARTEDPTAVQRGARLSAMARHLAFTDFQCATDGQLKVLRDSSGEQVIDLAADPLEVAPRPVAEYDPARIALLRGALDAADRSSHHSPIDDDETVTVAHEPETDALEQQMRLLGYM